MQTEDMAAFAEWYKTELGEQMTKCDICVRVYHQKKKRYLETLRGCAYVQRYLAPFKED